MLLKAQANKKKGYSFGCTRSDAIYGISNEGDTLFCMHKVSLMEECGFYQRALDELHKREPKIVDKLGFMEQEVSLLMKLDHFEEVEITYRFLLSVNPDNYGYYKGLLKCAGLYPVTGGHSTDQIDKLDALYKSLPQQYTCSSAVKVP